MHTFNKIVLTIVGIFLILGIGPDPTPLSLSLILAGICLLVADLYDEVDQLKDKS